MASPIRAARERAEMTQVDVCAKARVAPATLRAAEKWGAAAVSRESLRKIASALSIPVEQLEDAR